MRRACFVCAILFSLAWAGCGGVDKSVEVPKNPDPLPTEGPSAMSGPNTPPATSPPK